MILDQLKHASAYRNLGEGFAAGLDYLLSSDFAHIPDGRYEKISSQEVGRRVANVAAAMKSWRIGKGDRVAILSENRPQWAIADFATRVTEALQESRPYEAEKTETLLESITFGASAADSASVMAAAANASS